MILVRLLIRRHRAMLGVWLLVLAGLCGGTVSSYQNTYATQQQRRTAVALAQDNRATTLLYGRLPDPGTAAQMFAWELGAILTVLTAVMAVLVAVAVTRAAEDDGTVELVRGCGVAPRRPLHSALVLLAGLALVLGVACGGAVGLGGCPGGTQRCGLRAQRRSPGRWREMPVNGWPTPALQRPRHSVRANTRRCCSIHGVTRMANGREPSDSSTTTSTSSSPILARRTPS